MPKRHTTIRLSQLTDNQITELKELLGLDQAEVIAIAVDRFYREEARRVKEQAANEAAERD